jgi:xanthine dehydrogenase/oxidase
MPPPGPASTTARDKILVYINGSRRSLSASEVLDVTLLHHLRVKERLTGAKLGCGEGGCGACTVLVSRYVPGTRKLAHTAVNACLMPLAALDGSAVTTVEAVGDRAGGLSPLQVALANGSASQCGFCTPGIVMSAYALLRQRAADGEAVSEAAVEHAFDGNLCRCTGYRPILSSFRGLIRETGDPATALCAKGAGCCRNGGSACSSSSVGRGESALVTGAPDKESLGDCTKDLLFPPELVVYRPVPLNIADRWLRPVSLSGLLALRLSHPSAKLLGGNTEVGVEVRIRRDPKAPPSTYISTLAVPELNSVVEHAEDGLVIGAAATWADVLGGIKRAVSTRSATEKAYQTSSLCAIRDQLKLFAGTQVRNVASVGGNIVTASPISDLNPIWIAACAVFVVVDAKSSDERRIAARDFFLSYRKVDLRDTEVLVSIVVPWNDDCYDVTQAFKTSRRREDDIAIVSAGIRLRLKPPAKLWSQEPNGHGAGWTIARADVGLGGMAAKTISAEAVEKCLAGAPLDNFTIDTVFVVAKETLSLPDVVPGGMPSYRLALTLGFIFKALVNACSLARGFVEHGEVDAAGGGSVELPCLGLGATEVSSVLHALEARPLSTGSQIFASPTANTPLSATSHIGLPVVLASAKLQVNGEAKYVDDMAQASQHELHGALVLSRMAHAKILGVDTQVAISMPGVVDVVLASDVRGSNRFSVSAASDELCFAESVVTCMGQVIGLVLAETLEQAEVAVAAVDVDYEELLAVITIEEALDRERDTKGSHVITRHEIVRGNVDSALKEDETVGGTVRIGAQEHFYLEPNGSIVVPDENDEYVVYASTQAATKTQEVVSRVLGVPQHKVVCRVKRIGGGFGGKETRSVLVSAAAAVAAQKHNRPVRLILSREVDMLTMGTRHAFLANYECSFRPSGRITALRADLHLNVGNSQDLSIPVLDRALHHCQNCYDIENVSFTGVALRTNATSATAFRGFGGPQGMMIAETAVEHVAAATGVPPHVVRDLNLYGKHGNVSRTLVGMDFDAAPLMQCWDGVLSDARYERMVADAKAFNVENRFVKRGVSAIPTMFGISFTFKSYNQAGALVHVYHADGSILISHGGVEMGQGLHTKMCQVAATELGVPLEKVFIAETATDKVANSSPSAASASTDMYGMAVLDACKQLSSRLSAVRLQFPESITVSWEELVEKAWFDRVDLTAHGFYRTPELDTVDLSKPGASGRPFFYYTNGAAVSCVEIDTLTGHHSVLSTHIVMDVGRSLNPALDIGQIEGGFVQGMGWCTMEEVVRGGVKGTHSWLHPGQMHTLGPGAYKIPGFSDIPLEFSVRVLEGVRNEKDTIHSSKAIGEPPLFLASSVFFAIRHAISSAREEEGLDGWFELDSPATVERIRSACADFITKRLATGTGLPRPDLSL